MGLETFNFIDSLNSSNPVGATDVKGQGDDHLRGIKTTLLNSFPNITGAVTLTQAEINALPKEGDNNVWTGTNGFQAVTATDIIATTFAGDGALITALNAAELSSGLIPDARVQASNVTQHEASIDHDALTNFAADEHVAHSGVDITAGDGLSGGGDISATRSLAVDSTVVRTTGAQSIAGDKTFSDDVAVGKEFKTSGHSNVSTTGTINALATANVAYIRMTGVAQVTLNGMAGGVDGKRITIINQTSNVLLLGLEAGGATAANRLRFATTASISVGDAFEFIYDGEDLRWQMIGF